MQILREKRQPPVPLLFIIQTNQWICMKLLHKLHIPTRIINNALSLIEHGIITQLHMVILYFLWRQITRLQHRNRILQKDYLKQKASYRWKVEYYLLRGYTTVTTIDFNE